MGANGVADPTAIFIERHIARIVEPVLDTPMPLEQGAQTLLISVRRAQAGDRESGFFALGSIAQNAMTLDREQLGGVREIRLLGVDLHGDHPAAVNAPVAFDRSTFPGGKKANWAASASPWPAGWAGSL